MNNNFNNEVEGVNTGNVLHVDSKLLEIEDIVTEFRNVSEFEYTSLHINIHSLPAKFDKLKTLLTRLNDISIPIQFVLLCETFLTDTNVNLFEIPGYHFIYKNRKANSRGGVAMYIKEGIQFVNRGDLEIHCDSEFESLIIEATFSNSNVIVAELYRVPNTSESLSLDRFDQVVSNLSLTNKSVILATDQNFDYLKVEQHQHTSDLLNNFFAAGMFPTITQATRITPTTSTLIDNIYVNFQNKLETIRSGIICSDISDHFPIFMFYGRKGKLKKEPITFTSRHMNDDILAEINNRLGSIDWSYLLPLHIHQACSNLTDHITSVLDSVAPLRTTTIYPKQQILNPWMSIGLMKSSKTLDTLYREQIGIAKNHATHIKYTSYRRMYLKLKRHSKNQYYSDLFNQYRNDIRKTWQTLNSIIGRNKTKNSDLKMFKINNKSTTDTKTIANGFCEYFTSVGEKFAANIPPPVHSYQKYMGKNIMAKHYLCFQLM